MKLLLRTCTKIDKYMKATKVLVIIILAAFYVNAINIGAGTSLSQPLSLFEVKPQVGIKVNNNEIIGSFTFITKPENSSIYGLYYRRWIPIKSVNYFVLAGIENTSGIEESAFSSSVGIALKHKSIGIPVSINYFKSNHYEYVKLLIGVSLNVKLK